MHQHPFLQRFSALCSSSSRWHTPRLRMLFRCHSLIFSHSPLPTSHHRTSFHPSDSGYSSRTLPFCQPFGFHYAANESRVVWFRWRCLLKDMGIKPYHCSDTNIWEDKKPEPICLGGPQLPQSTPCMAPATAIWSCDCCSVTGALAGPQEADTTRHGCVWWDMQGVGQVPQQTTTTTAAGKTRAEGAFRGWVAGYFTLPTVRKARGWETFQHHTATHKGTIDKSV